MVWNSLTSSMLQTQVQRQLKGLDHTWFMRRNGKKPPLISLDAITELLECQGEVAHWHGESSSVLCPNNHKWFPFPYPWYDGSNKLCFNLLQPFPIPGHWSQTHAFQLQESWDLLAKTLAVLIKAQNQEGQWCKIYVLFIPPPPPLSTSFGKGHFSFSSCLGRALKKKKCHVWGKGLLCKRLSLRNIRQWVFPTERQL